MNRALLFGFFCLLLSGWLAFIISANIRPVRYTTSYNNKKDFYESNEIIKGRVYYEAWRVKRKITMTKFIIPHVEEKVVDHWYIRDNEFNQ